MDDLLPIVDPEVGNSVAQGIDDDERKYLKRQLKHIEKTNPTIAEFITRWSTTAKKSDMVQVALCGVLVYKLLESQAEVDRMDDEINLG